LLRTPAGHTSFTICRESRQANCRESCQAKWLLP